MGDVPPIPLGDDDEFFSDLGGDDPYQELSSDKAVGRLVIDVENSDVNSRHNRANPFSSTEVRGRNSSSSTANGDSSAWNRSSSRNTHHNHYHNTNSSDQTSSIWTDHCHIARKHEADNVARNQLIAVSLFTMLFLVGEGIGAVLSKSIALGTDVMHLGSDLLSFIISLVALYLAKKPPTKGMTWGFYRAEVLGAVLSVFIIWLVTGILVYLAALRIINHTYDEIEPLDMLITAACGVAFNVIMALILNLDICKCKVSHGHSHGGGSHSHSHNSMVPLGRSRNHGDEEQLTLNTDDPVLTDDDDSMMQNGKKERNIVIRAAFVHVLGDLIQSIGVLIASLIIYFMGAKKAGIADPICTFIFSVLVLITTVTVLRDSFRILMEGKPGNTSYENLYRELYKLEAVKNVHSLRIWSLTSNELGASVHLGVDEATSKPFYLIKKATAVLRHDGNITHTTVQIEPYNQLQMALCKDCNNPKTTCS